MVQHFKVTIFGDCLPVYDGKKSLYTANALRVASGGVRLCGGDHMLVFMDKNQCEQLSKSAVPLPLLLCANFYPMFSIPG